MTDNQPGAYLSGLIDASERLTQAIQRCAVAVDAARESIKAPADLHAELAPADIIEFSKRLRAVEQLLARAVDVAEILDPEAPAKPVKAAELPAIVPDAQAGESE